MDVYRWMLILAIGCKGGANAPTTYGYTVDSGFGTVTVAGTRSTSTVPTTTETESDDERMFWDLLHSGRPLEEVMPGVAWGQGWPVATAMGPPRFHFVLPTNEPGPWYLAGDHDGWVGQEMLRGTGYYYLPEVSIPNPEGSKYKFFGPGEPIADPWARSYTYDELGEISYVRPPADGPRLDRWPYLEDDAGVLPWRDLMVYVPPGPGPFRTLYAHDGQNLFDPEGVLGGWHMLDALDGRDLLVVGIANTSARMDEYTHVLDEYRYQQFGGLGDDYARLVHDQIRPHVETEYGSAPSVGLLGSSLGGLISLYIAEQQPGEWDFVGAMSATLGWGAYGLNNPTMDAIYAGVAPGDLVLYLDSGSSAGVDGVCADPDGDGYPEDDPDSEDNYCTTRQFVDNRAAQGWTWDVDLFHWHEPGATHDEPSWAARVHRPLDVFEGL